MNSSVALDELYQAFFAQVYQHTQSYVKTESGEKSIQIQSGINSTYGEMHYFSVKKLIHYLNITPEDVFVDLGSGLGKLALQVFIQSQAGKVIGIEALSFLNQQTYPVLPHAREKFPECWENNRVFKLIEDNFLTAHWEDPTIIYTCSTCFRMDLLDAIGLKINDTPSVKQVLSLRPLPTLNRFQLKRVFTVECSWDSALCYHYVLIPL